MITLPSIFLKRNLKKKNIFTFPPSKFQRLPPVATQVAQKKREKSINKAFISRGEKLVNGKKALKNNFSSFPQPRSEFNQRFSYLSIYPPLLSASWKTNYGDVRCNRNTVCNDRFYSNRTESELILMNQRGSERGRRILCSFNSEHEFCYINSQYSTRECIGECLKNNEATVIISIERKGPRDFHQCIHSPDFNYEK